MSKINTYAYGHKSSIPCLRDDCTFSAEETEIDFKFAHNVVIKGDEITFDAGIEATFIIQCNKWSDWEDDSGSEWFLLKCQM